MYYVKWTLWLVVALILAGFLHYTLPQRDIVRIVNTEVRRMDFGDNSIFWASADSGTDATAINRDIRFIEAVRPDGAPSVYRNEDTGWGWPPYFKFDSSDLQTEAADLISTRDAPVWVAIRHYGWRSQLLTAFPNAVGVRQVEGPEVRIIPWLNISILVTLLIVVLVLRQMWIQFRRRTIDPLISDAGDSWDRMDRHIDDRRGRIRKWFGGKRR